MSTAKRTNRKLDIKSAQKRKREGEGETPLVKKCEKLEKSSEKKIEEKKKMGGQDPKQQQNQNKIQKKVQNEPKKGENQEAYGRGHQRDRKV